jgi:hypothetical protein
MPILSESEVHRLIDSLFRSFQRLVIGSQEFDGAEPKERQRRKEGR